MRELTLWLYLKNCQSTFVITNPSWHTDTEGWGSDLSGELRNQAIILDETHIFPKKIGKTTIFIPKPYHIASYKLTYLLIHTSYRQFLSIILNKNPLILVFSSHSHDIYNKHYISPQMCVLCAVQWSYLIYSSEKFLLLMKHMQSHGEILVIFPSIQKQRDEIITPREHVMVY